MTARLVRGAALAALLCVLGPGVAAGGGDAPRAFQSKVEARSGQVVVTLDLGAAFPTDLRRQLSNGLTNVVVLHVALLPEHGGEPAAIYVREVDILYDVWDETWGVTVKETGNAPPRTRTFARWDELRRFLADARALVLGPVSQLDGRSWVVQTRLELNPVSPELIRRTRELMAHTATAGRGGAPSRSVLGAMASYLLRGPEPGADVHMLRSDPFTLRDLEGT